MFAATQIQTEILWIPESATRTLLTSANYPARIRSILLRAVSFDRAKRPRATAIFDEFIVRNQKWEGNLEEFTTTAPPAPPPPPPSPQPPVQPPQPPPPPPRKTAEEKQAMIQTRLNSLGGYKKSGADWGLAWTEQEGGGPLIGPSKKRCHYHAIAINKDTDVILENTWDMQSKSWVTNHNGASPQIKNWVSAISGTYPNLW